MLSDVPSEASAILDPPILKNFQTIFASYTYMFLFLALPARECQLNFRGTKDCLFLESMGYLSSMQSDFELAIEINQLLFF